MDDAAIATMAAGLERRDPDAASLAWLHLAQQRKYPPALMQLAAHGVDGFGKIAKNRANARELLVRLVAMYASPHVAEHGRPDPAAPHDAPAAALPLTAAFPAFVLGSLLLRERVEAAAGRELPRSRIVLTDIPVGDRRHSDCDRAFHLLRGVAATGRIPQAHLNLAHCWMAGVGCNASMEQARGALRDGVRAGDPACAVELASLNDATATGADRANAEWQRTQHGLWRTAALTGHPVAMHNMGVWYLSPPRTDADAALVWFEKAGNAGMVQAALNAGKLRLNGTPTAPSDPAAAVRWFDKAALISRAALSATGALALPPAAATGYQALLTECSALRAEATGAQGGEHIARPATAAPTHEQVVVAPGSQTLHSHAIGEGGSAAAAGTMPDKLT
jgi:TPR repeat protein